MQLLTHLVQCVQGKLREIEKKMKLENDRYEELMIDLALLKKKQGHSDFRGEATPATKGTSSNPTTMYFIDISI